MPLRGLCARAHRRSGYSLSGCVPAEPDSASPDIIILRNPTEFIIPPVDTFRGIYSCGADCHLSPLRRWFIWERFHTALYLTHENIGFVVIRGLYTVTKEPIVILVVPIAVALGLASLLTFLVERPAMKAIRSVHKRRRETREAQAVLTPVAQPTES